MATTLTRADLAALPDDGLRHELIDGAFVMTPAPGARHQWMVGGLFVILRNAFANSEHIVTLAPFDVVLAGNVVQPDVLVAPRDSFSERMLSSAPLLVVEVRSPATGWLDEGRKREIYAAAGVLHYWLADPAAPSITILELVDGRYRQIAHVAGADTIEIDSPISTALNPARLLQG
jgi:Uma2 family endonuclease